MLLAVAAYSFARGEAEDTVREVQKVGGVGCEWYGIVVHAHCCHKVHGRLYTAESITVV